MISLSAFVRSCYAPTFLYGQRSIRTLKAYLESAKLYVDFVGDIKIDFISPARNAVFLNGLKSLQLSNETIRKHCRHLNLIFAKMGPPGPRNRDALGFLPQAPWIRPPRQFIKLPKIVENDSVNSLVLSTYDTPACYEYPRYLEPELRPIWWKCLIQFISTTALRKKAVFSLSWLEIDKSQRFLTVPYWIDKARTERRKPVHPQVLQLLQAIRATDSDLLFPWRHGSKKFYQCWHNLNETAGILPRLTLHDLKRFALQSAVRAGVDAATLQMLGDHSTLKTTVNHYIREDLEKYINTVVLPGQEAKQ